MTDLGLELRSRVEIWSFCHYIWLFINSPSQLMPTRANVWFLTTELHGPARQPCLFIISRPLAESPHTCKAISLKLRPINSSWLLGLGFNLTLPLALGHSQDHTYPPQHMWTSYSGSTANILPSESPQPMRPCQCVHYFVTLWKFEC